MPQRVRTPRRLLILLAVALGFMLIVPAGVLGRIAPPSRDPALATAPAAGSFTLNFARPVDFVAQTNFVQCVGASMQMMLNIIGPGVDRTAAMQLALQTVARSLSGRRPDGVNRQGASVQGWTAGLNVRGAGPYRTVGATNIAAILKIAARAMRETGRPVGLLVWRGRHAWVMAGFTATADPRLTDDFVVTSVVVLDPLYPYGSATWGPSPKPGESLSVADLGRQFVPRGFRSPLAGGGTDPAQASSQGLTGKYVIVMPAAVAGLARTGFWAS